MRYKFGRYTMVLQQHNKAFYAVLCVKTAYGRKLKKNYQNQMLSCESFDETNLLHNIAAPVSPYTKIDAFFIFLTNCQYRGNGHQNGLVSYFFRVRRLFYLLF